MLSRLAQAAGAELRRAGLRAGIVLAALALSAALLFCAALFLMLAGFFWLEPRTGPAPAAAIVGVLVALLALVLALLATRRDPHRAAPFASPAFRAEVEAAKAEIAATADPANLVRIGGPMQVAVGALVLGIVLGRKARSASRVDER